MWRRGRWGVRIGIALCAAAVVWLLLVGLRSGWSVADPVASVFGSATGLVAMAVTLWAIPSPRTGVVRTALPEVPEWWVDRNEAEAVIRAIRLRTGRRRSGSAVTSTIGLHGAGGFGKTSLARYVAAQPSVQRRFPGGVHLITIGRDVRGRAAVAAKVAAETRFITGDTTEAGTDPERAGAHLGSLLAERPRTLLVIDDVWEREQLTPFLRGAERTCVRLVTTRRPEVLPSTAARIKVDRMTELQARTLLAHRLPIPPRRDVVDNLVKATGRWALLLGIANKFIVDQTETGADPTAAAEALLERLLADGPTAQDPDGTLDLDDPERRNTAVRASIKAATTLLQASEAEDRFLELGIFADNEAVPMALVVALWQTTGGLDESATRTLCKQMADLSLLGINADLSGGAITLHDVVRDYLRAELRRTACLAGANTALLDTLAQSLPVIDGSVAWWDTTSGYLRDHLIEHLVDAGCTTQAVAVASDYRWVCARLHQRGPTAPWHDLDRVGAPARTLARQLSRAAHLLTPTVPPHALNAILRSRITDAPNWPTVAPPAEPSALFTRWPPPDLPDPALLRTLTGHTELVSSAAVGPDDAWIATASKDRTVRIWNPATGQEVHTLVGHNELVTSVAVSSDGAWIATTSGDRTVRIWDPVTGQELHSLVRQPGLTSAAFGPDGSWLATTCDDWTVRIWDPVTGHELRKLSGHTEAVSSVAVGPDGSWLASASKDRTVRIWDPVTGQELNKLTSEVQQIGRVPPMRVSPDGTWLALPNGITVRIWNRVTNQTLQLSDHTSPVVSVAFSQDSSRLATVSDHTVRIWDLATVRTIRTLAGHTSKVTSAVFSLDGSWLATTSDDKTLRIWDPDSREVLRTPTVHRRAVSSVSVSPEGNWLATTSDDRTLRIWDPDTGQELRSLDDNIGLFSSVAVAPNGRLLVWTSNDRNDQSVRIWDPMSGRQLHTLGSHTGAVTAVAVCSGADWVATASAATVQIWDAVTGVAVRTLTGHTGLVISLAASPDGSWLATAGNDHTLRLWDPATGQELHMLSSSIGLVTSVAVSPDGAWLATAGDDRAVRIWNPANGEELCTLNGYTDLFPLLTVSPDSTCLVVSSGAVARIWSSAGTALCMLSGHTADVTSVAFSPDGTWLATTSNDHTLRIWRTATGEALTMMRAEGPLMSCIWTPDGRGLLIGGKDGLFGYDLYLNP